MRILIIGTSGSGKSTLARRLASVLKLPHFELDALYWKKNWRAVSDPVFLLRLSRVTSRESWIIEGDYDLGRELLWKRAEVIIWLDFPWYVTFWRLMKRSLIRLFTRERLWQGNRETWRAVFFSRESLFFWFFKSYRRSRKLYPSLLSLPEFRHIRLFRVTDHLREDVLANVH